MRNATFYRSFYLDSFYFVSTWLTSCQPKPEKHRKIQPNTAKNPLARALLVRKRER